MDDFKQDSLKHSDQQEMDKLKKAKTQKDPDSKWDFSDWAFTITGIIVGVLLLGPELLEGLFDLTLFNGSIADTADGMAAALEAGQGLSLFDFNNFRALSPMLFMWTVTITMFYEAFEARHGKIDHGTLFTHTFESLLEDAIYMLITTIMLYAAIFAGAMYVSWLASPIQWIIFVFLMPLLKRLKYGSEPVEKPYLLLFIFAIGILVEVFTNAWIAFPLTWMFICAIKLIKQIRESTRTLDDVFNILYYSFSVLLLAVGVLFGSWMASWIAFPFAVGVCWILSKTKRYRKEKIVKVH